MQASSIPQLGLQATPAQEEVTLGASKCCMLLVCICSQFGLCLFWCQVIDLNVRLCKERNLPLSSFCASHNILPASGVVHMARAELGSVCGPITPINAPLPVHLYAVVCLHIRACSDNAQLGQLRQCMLKFGPKIQKRNQCNYYENQRRKHGTASTERSCAMLAGLGHGSCWQT